MHTHLLVDTVDLGKVVHVLEEDGRLEHMSEVRARGLDDSGKVVERALGLRLDTTLDTAHGLGVERDAAADESEAVVHGRLARSIARQREVMLSAALLKLPRNITQTHL